MAESRTLVYYPSFVSQQSQAWLGMRWSLDVSTQSSCSLLSWLTPASFPVHGTPVLAHPSLSLSRSNELFHDLTKPLTLPTM